MFEISTVTKGNVLQGGQGEKTKVLAQVRHARILDVLAEFGALSVSDVAGQLGVSEMTVSRVLRNRGDVSQSTREKVLEAAKSLGYVPNKIAGALASQRVNLVAVIIPSLRNMVFPEVLTGISQVLDDTGLQPVVGLTGYRPEKEEQVLYEMLSWRPAGVIIAGLEHSEASRAMLAASGIPVVEIMDVDGTPVDSVVGISHRRAGQQMAQAIIRAGYRRIGFMGTKMPLDHRARKRFEGFTEALAKGGIEMADHEFYSGGSALAKGRGRQSAVMSALYAVTDGVKCTLSMLSIERNSRSASCARPCVAKPAINAVHVISLGSTPSRSSPAAAASAAR